jgi:hypothetical protein
VSSDVEAMSDGEFIWMVRGLMFEMPKIDDDSPFGWVCDELRRRERTAHDDAAIDRWRRLGTEFFAWLGPISEANAAKLFPAIAGAEPAIRCAVCGAEHAPEGSRDWSTRTVHRKAVPATVALCSTRCAAALPSFEHAFFDWITDDEASRLQGGAS